MARIPDSLPKHGAQLTLWGLTWAAHYRVYPHGAERGEGLDARPDPDFNGYGWLFLDLDGQDFQVVIEIDTRPYPWLSNAIPKTQPYASAVLYDCEQNRHPTIRYAIEHWLCAVGEAVGFQFGWGLNNGVKP